MTGTFEKWYPLAFAPMGMAAGLLVARYVTFSETQSIAVLQSIISVASILTGFLGTAIAIVVSFLDSATFTNIRHLGHDKRLIDYMLRSVYGLLVVVITSLLLLMWPHAWWSMSLIAILTFAITYSSLALHRITTPLHNILENVRSEKS